MKKTIAISIIACLLIVYLPGCQVTSSGVTSESATTASATEAPATTAPATTAQTTAAAADSSAEPVTVEFWDPELRDDGMAAWAAFIEKFENANPLIKIERVSIPWNDENPKLQAAAAANSMPNIVHAFHTYHAGWGYQGFAREVNDLVDEFGGPDNFASGPMLRSTVDGVIYAIPFIFYPHVIHYRKDLYEKYNLSIPTTWDELYENAKTIQDGELSEGTYGFYVYNAGEQPYPLVNLMATNDAHAFDKDANIVINSLETIEALAFLQKLLTVSPPGSITRTDNSSNAFLAGEAAHIWSSTSFINTVVAEDALDKFGTFPTPVQKGEFQAFCDFGAFTITKQPEGQPEAMDFIRYFFKKENSMEFYQNFVIGLLPTNKSILESDEFWNYPRIAKAADSLKAALPVADNGIGMFMDYGSTIYAAPARSENILGKMVEYLDLEHWTPEQVAEWAEEELITIKADIDSQ